MKQYRISFALLASIALVFFACKNSTSPGGGGGGGALNSGLTATVNGAAWVPTITSSGSTWVGTDTVSSFTGSNDTSVLDIRIRPHLPFGDTGTYSFGDPLSILSDTAGGAYTLRNVTYEPIPKSGTIHLTVWTASHITATFNFKAKDSNGDSVTVTNGSLDMDR